MALVVESTSFAKATNSANVVVTKPAGVSTGDLLLVLTTGSHTCTGFTATAITGDAVVLYRIADASDVSASNYTVTGPDSDNSGMAAMMRISGWVSGNPIYAYDTLTQTADASGTIALGKSSLDILRPSSNAIMLFLNSFVAGAGALSNTSYSGHSVTSGESNPSWTEICDDTYNANGSTSRGGLNVAYATTTSTSAISAFTCTATTDTLGDQDTWYSYFIVLAAPQSATATNAVFQTTPVYFSPLTGSTQTVTNALHESTPTLMSQSGRGTTPTQWANESPATTEWTNET
jgi:hypothetical protein